MKKIKIEDAVGMVLGHDVTQIIPGKYKGPRFKRGHKIKKEEIPEFLKIGKEHVFVMELKPGMIHEDDAALRLGKAFSGKNLKIAGPSEGKVTLHSKIKGLLQTNLPFLHRINLSKNIILSTIHRYTPCTPGMTVGATRIISLTAPEMQIEKIENWCEKYGPVIEVLPYRKLNIGVVVTGNEFFKGRTEDRFDDKVGEKINQFGSRVVKKRIVPDDVRQIAQSLKEFSDDLVDLILVTGGLSVDPDDVTRAGIKKAGTRIIFYGTPILPGAMFLYGILGEKPVLGLPACVFHHNATLFDLIFPRILAGETLKRREISLLGHGGFCRNCEPCHFPVCPFGKG
ncbi:MAG: molybdopterin-binding protein [Thermodesulfobacteriota bacterium]|nr:molybdopterin-binding protein [Thermodesulfobacteriota bacterium]